MHLVEAVFNSDLHVQESVASKRQQHAQLCRNLHAFGWRDVQLHVFVVGHLGAMRMENASILQAIGVDHANIQPFLTRAARRGIVCPAEVFRYVALLPLCGCRCGCGAWQWAHPQPATIRSWPLRGYPAVSACQAACLVLAPS